MNPARPPSVRLALPAEASAIAELQLASWTAQPELGVAVELPSPEEAGAAWLQAIMAPPLATCRVLVALDGESPTPAGFAVTGPSDDEDADETTGLIAEFVIAPEHRGQGHGTRLLQACVDTLAADGFSLLTWWLPSTDDATRGLATATGWAADGAHRSLGTDDASDATLRQVRLHTSVA